MQWSSDETPLQLNVRAFGGFKGQEVRMPNREVAFSFEVFSDCPNLERVVFSPPHLYDTYLIFKPYQTPKANSLMQTI